MINLKDIELNGDVIRVYVESFMTAQKECYSLEFNYKTGEFKASIQEVDLSDIAKIKHKLTSYLDEGKELPKEACIACF